MGKSKKEKPEKFLKIEKPLANEISNFLFALGNSFIKVKNAEGAFDCFRYSVDLNNQNQASVYNLGALYNSTGNLEGAIMMFKRAVLMSPEDITARTALCEVLRKSGDLDGADKALQEVFRMDPDNYLVLSALAVLHYDKGNLAEALHWNNLALAKRPNDIHMRLNEALIQMAYGAWNTTNSDGATWWSVYEFCLSYQKNERMRQLKMSDAWAGEEHEGKTLLVVSDQGSGDAVQFSRYLLEAKIKGKFQKLIYLVQPDLVPLVSRIPGIDLAVGFSDTQHVDWDVFSSLLGVMRVLQVTPENCYRPPHLETDPALDAVWKYRVESKLPPEKKRIGIVWAGDPRHGNDTSRSIPISHFVKLVGKFGDRCQFYSLQVGAGEPQLEALSVLVDAPNIVNLGEQFRTFDDTASALRQMDLLITCDTSVAHVAGCLGTPFWALVPNPPEWRWGLYDSKVPWYGDAEVFRQKTPRDWNFVFDAVSEKLEEFSTRREDARIPATIF